MKRADPLKSEGARLERKAIRRAIRRRRQSILTAASLNPSWAGGCVSAFDDLMEFVQGRQKRYDASPGGLGKR